MRFTSFVFLLVFGLFACAKSTNNGLAEIEKDDEIIQKDSTNTMNPPTGTLNLTKDSQAVVEVVTFGDGSFT